MKRAFLFGILVFFGLIVSCNSNDNSFDIKAIQSFNSWAQSNIDGKYRIGSVLYDTVGTPFDYIYKGYMLNQTVGSSGKTEADNNIASNLIMQYAFNDSTYLTKEIIIATINIYLKESDTAFYIGMRGDSICTEPKPYIYEALKETHLKGEQKIYEAVQEVKTNLDSYVNSNSINRLNNNDFEKDFYVFWIGLPGYKETIQALSNSKDLRIDESKKW